MKKFVILFGLLVLASLSIAQPFKTVRVDQTMLRVVPAFERPVQQIPRLTSSLNQVVQLYLRNQDYRTFAQSSNIKIDRDKIVVTIFPEPGSTTDRIDLNLLRSFGVEVKAVAAHSMRVAIPIAQLENVARSVKNINRIEEPPKPKPYATTDEGVTLMNASEWQSKGYTGSGIKVAVIDLGFYKYSGAVANGDLTGTEVTYDFTGKGLETGTEHGTAVAEAVHDVAPGTSLYLYKIEDITDLELAENACKANNVDVVNHSVGWYNASYYDGTGDVCDVANDAISNGIIWVNAAGNDAQKHYRSVFHDAGDGTHDFSGSGGNVNYFGPEVGTVYNIPGGTEIDVFLNWDAYPNTREDYDLALYYLTGSGWSYRAGSFNNQAGSNLPPTEEIHYKAASSGAYGVVVSKWSTTMDHDLTLFNWVDPFVYRTASSSVTDPASALNVVTVGAIDRNNYASGPQEDFSSQGPTTNGQTKPDVTAPDNCNSYAYGYWFGTSLASPHVAGCVALIHSRFPSKSDAEVKDYLYNNCTVGLGTLGQDNIYGYGKVELPSFPIPIQLASSTASVIRDNDVEVAWKTVSETNNYGFELYRRRGETEDWKKVGFVEGHGTTLAPQSYNYVDKSVGFGKYFYRIKQIDLDGKSQTFPEMNVVVGVAPGQFLLAQNYPNPFNPSTAIEFTVPQAGFVTMKVYNVLGQEVGTLFKGDAEAGKINTARFDASNLPSGVYFYRLRAGQFVKTKKLVVLK